MGYVPSALGEPRGAIYWCDNRCSEKAIRYWQIASVVIEAGGEVRTINLCKLCYNEKFVQQGKEPRKLWEWKGVVEKKAHRRRLWLVFGSEQFLHGMWEYFTLKWAGARKNLVDAAQEKQEGKQGQRQHGTSVQKSSGTSQKKCGYRLRSPDNAPCLHRNEAWQLGEFSGRTQEGRKAL